MNIVRLRKIYELSLRGIDGEKENAQMILESMLKHHNLTVEDLFADQKNYFPFRYKHEMEKTLLRQIAAMVCDTSSIELYLEPKKRNCRLLYLTQAEFLEIDYLYEQCKQALEKEQSKLLHAFVQKNQLFPSSGKKLVKDELSIEDQKRLNEILKMAESVEIVSKKRRLALASSCQ